MQQVAEFVFLISYADILPFRGLFHTAAAATVWYNSPPNYYSDQLELIIFEETDWYAPYKTDVTMTVDHSP